MGKHRNRDIDSDDETPSSASSSSFSSYSSDESDSSSRKRRKKIRERRKSDGVYEREKRRKREKEKKRKKMEMKERKKKDKKKKKRMKKRDYESDTESQSCSDSMSDQESSLDHPETLVKKMLLEFPNVGNDLKQLLKMIDDGQAVDIKGISESALKKWLKKLFLSLKLKERGDGVFLLPQGASPSLDLVGHLIKGSEEEVEKNVEEPETVVKEMLMEFPNVGNDLKQLLKMIDDGQAVDIKGISESALKKQLKKLFLSLKLKERGDRVFLLPPGASPSLDIVGHLIKGDKEEIEKIVSNSGPTKNTEAASTGGDGSNSADDVTGPKKRVIGPAMPSAELLAAAAKLTEAQAELREAELEEDSGYFIGPAPPAVVAEVASSNEAERFEEVTRIMEADVDSPYDVLGVNHNMAADSMKKRYWKLSLLVHPDKCSHPQAQQAFVLLNKAFKELQDPEKRKAMDDKIKLKEEKEAFKAELRSMQEAAQWRRSQGISMEGDEELLAATEVKPVPKRDEWMTTLPPERKAGVAVQQSTTTFSRNAREGRGDTTAWTDTPMDKAERAKMNYLEAYNKANALASNEMDNMKRSMDAELVDKYNKEKRSKSLVEKHKQESGCCSSSSSHLKKKKKRLSSSSSKEQSEKDEWAGKHPWKPWDRENDLSAGRQNVKLDAESMAEGLASKFSTGNFQRSFL